MAKKYIVEKEFNHNGLKCVVTFGHMGHRCGYVGIPKWHPLYGKDYADYLDIKKEDIEGKEISGVFPLLGALIDEDERVRIDAYFTCHGGITYSGGGKNSTYPIDSNLWWFGFDCAHNKDGKDLDLAIETFPEFAQQIAMTKATEDMFPTYGIVRSAEYVVDNCKELADQLAQFSCIVKMSIDEAISRERQQAEEHEQIANWLEELKALKDNSISKEAFEKMKSKSHLHGYRQGYSKAIDDFAEEAIKIVYDSNDRDMVADIHYKLMDLAKLLKEQSK